MGDPAGISNELAVHLLSDGEMTRDCATLVIGDRRILALLQEDAATALDASKKTKDWIDGAIALRFADHVQALRREAGKDWVAKLAAAKGAAP